MSCKTVKYAVTVNLRRTHWWQRQSNHQFVGVYDCEPKPEWTPEICREHGYLTIRLEGTVVASFPAGEWTRVWMEERA